ncbi:MAG: zinc-ribbon domain-containing protein [Planctomycetes bacterium]|nr:zinc-ribbon domain-containing protein [Planctomycetota bacterium]
MAIELRCSQCGAALRVPDELAGKPVRCPKCQAVSTAPAPASAGPPNPFADEPYAAAAASPVNPYAPPKPAPSSSAHPYAPPMIREAAASKTTGPAIGMMVYAGLGGSLVILNVVVSFMAGVENVSFGPPPETEAERIGQTVGVFIGAGVAGALMLAIAIGAYKMMKLESYGLAMTACILSMLPCSICCPLGLAFGIWGLVVLNDPGVKHWFDVGRNI